MDPGVSSMPEDLRDLTPEEILRQDGWLRDLVRSLASDEAEDVVQSTWAAALARAPLAGRLPAWLTVVARNFARRSSRARCRRQEREARAARSGEVPSTEHTLELLDLQQHVARAVAELREPYRTAVLLRHYHGLPTQAIAERTGATPANVRQRLKRGLDALREALRERYGASWGLLPALAFLAPARPELAGVPVRPLVSWMLEMKIKKSAVATAVLLVVAAGAGWTVWSTRAPRIAPVLGDAPSGPESPGANASARESEPQAAPSSSPRRAIGESPAERAPLAPLTGRVVDRQGRALAGVGLAAVADYAREIPPQGVEHAGAAAHSAIDGTFELATELERGSVVAAAGWVPLAERAHFTAEDAERGERLIVVAPAVELAGQVTDEQGRPLAGVEIQVVGRWLEDYPGSLVGTGGYAWLGSTTDVEGRFRHRDLPGGAARLSFAKEGYVPVVLEVGELDEPQLAVVLAATGEAPYVVTGWVTDPSGAPLAGALVGLAERTARTDAAGRFELSVPADALHAYDDLFAAQPGWRTRVVEDLGSQLLADADRGLELDLRIEGRSLALAGKVVDPAGAPVPGMLVYLWGEPELVDGRCAEEFALPAERQTVDQGGGEMRVWSRSDADGRFRLEGLREREYRVRLFDRKRHAALTTEPLRAGSEGLVLTIPADFTRRLEGRVVDLAGRPVAGATLAPMVWTFLGSRKSVALNGPQVSSDAEGRFVLEEAAGKELSLSVWGEGLLESQHSLQDGALGAGLELVVERLCDFRILFDDPARESLTFEVLDARGEPMQIVAAGAGEYTSTFTRSVSEGRTRVLSVGESAATLVLKRWQDGQPQEVERVPLALRPGEVNDVRL